MKKGKLPLSQKSTENSDFAGVKDRSRLRVPSPQIEELASRGLAHRWISRKKFQDEGNMHRNDWEPYKFESLKKAAGDIVFGSSPDGYLIRGDMVLAAKKLSLQAEHRSEIKFKTNAQSQVVKNAA